MRSVLLVASLSWFASDARADASCDAPKAKVVEAPRDAAAFVELGACHERHGRVASALVAYRKARAIAMELSLAELEARAAERARSLDGSVPVAILNVAEPAATVEIDGYAIPATTFGRVELDPGTHQLVARAPGKAPARITLEARASERRVVDVAFVPAVPMYEDRGRTRRRAGVGVMLTGTALLVGVGIYGFVERNNYEKATTDAEAEDAKTRLQTVGTVGFVTGVAAIAVGAVLYFGAPDKELVSDGTALVPTASDDSIGLAVLGSF